MRVPGAAPPDIALRVGGLGLHLGIDLSGALARHRDGDSGFAFEGRGNGATPFFLHAAIHDEISRRCCRKHPGKDTHHHQWGQEGFVGAECQHFFLRTLPAPTARASRWPSVILMKFRRQLSAIACWRQLPRAAPAADFVRIHRDREVGFPASVRYRPARRAISDAKRALGSSKAWRRKIPCSQECRPPGR